MNQKIAPDFYLQPNTEEIAQKLLGKHVCTNINSRFCRAMITETEAYTMNDRACHAFGGRRTARNEPMFQTGGISYVYLCYGIHRLFNIVTNRKGIADAVLVRAVRPLEGVEHMLIRRKMENVHQRLTSGPGSVSEALGIQLVHNRVELWGDTVWLEEGEDFERNQITTTTRIGVPYAGPDALLPRRFYVTNSPFVSKR